MTTTATVVFRSLFSDALACTRCGSENVFPAPGPFGALGAVVGFARHLCRPCGRSFWMRATAGYAMTEEAEAEPQDLGALLAEPAEPVAFEIDVSQPESEPVDLLALDAEFERRCAAAKQPRRRSRRRRRAVAKTS